MNETEEMMSRQISGLQIFDDDKKTYVVSCLALREKMTMEQIERACSMNEPKASKVLNSLIEIGFVTVESDDKGAVGRPKNIYRLVDGWKEKISNKALNSVDDKLKKLRVINTLLSSERESGNNAK